MVMNRQDLPRDTPCTELIKQSNDLSIHQASAYHSLVLLHKITKYETPHRLMGGTFWARGGIDKDKSAVAEGHFMWALGPQPAKRVCLPQGLEVGARSVPHF